jgi:hypothetical protein
LAAVFDDPVVCRKPDGRKCDAYPSVVVLIAGPRSITGSAYHGAAMGTEAARFLVLWMAGWIHSRQLEVIDFRREENRAPPARRSSTEGDRTRHLV